MSLSGRSVRLVGSAGVSLTELLFCIALTATLTGLALPGMLTGLDHARAAAAARYLAGQARLARMMAVSRSTTIALRFEPEGEDFWFAFYEDGNANGVRNADIRRGIDPRTTPLERIGDRFLGVVLGVADDVTSVGGGSTELGDDPVRLGRSNLLSFTPIGTSTSGTVYLRGRGGAQFAVRVLGATGRTRVLEFNFGMGKWLPR